MALTTPARSGSAARPARPARRGAHPAKRMLLGASLMVMVGSFLPWIATPIGSMIGMRGAGLWTFYAAMLGFAGVMVPLRRLAMAQAGVLAAAAVGLVTWQVVHLLSLVGTAGWRPGPGLVLVAGGGVLAGVAAYRLRRDA